MYTEIFSETELFADYIIEQASEKDHIMVNKNEKSLKNLNKLNIFIGSNNSGKSRLMRELFYVDVFKSSNIFYLELTPDILIKNTLDKAKEEVNRIKSLQNSNLYENLERLRKKVPIRMFTYKYLSDFNSNLLNFPNYEPKLHETLKTLHDKLEIMSKNQKELENSYQHTYIPILRGLRPIQYDQSGKSNLFNHVHDNYKLRTENDYFRTKQNNTTIFSGLNLYEDIKKLLLGNWEKRKKIKDFEEFLSKTFFNNKEVNLVPKIDDDVLNIKIDSEEKPIYNLGDGIQSIIILTYPLFFSDTKFGTFFFEEPEIHLHPGLQRVFVETLMHERFKNYQYFITTHSNHFLDLTLELDNISVYKFKRQEQLVEGAKFSIENVSHGDQSVLSELGIRNSSIFLSNCTIWVEGITDRLYLRKYLDLYMSELDKDKKQHKEDLHYSFVEYGGNNITHWSFLEADDENHSNIEVERICNKIFLIADRDSEDLKKDGTKSNKTKRKEQLAAKLGDNFYCLKAREIENTLSKHVIIAVIKAYEPKNNEINFNLFTDEFVNEPIGAFIDEHITGKEKNYAVDSKTIKDKLDFCKKAVAVMKTTADLSDEAKQLAEKLYKFIERSN